MTCGPSGSSSPGRPTQARVDLDALMHNVRLAVSLAGPKRRVLAVVKADAYGHGGPRASRAALAAGATMLGVATVSEARALRASGITAPMLLLSEPDPGCAAELAQLDCSLTVYTPAFVEALQAAARCSGRRVAVHLKIDTGMGRVGVGPADAPAFAARLRECTDLVLEGVMSHPSEAEQPGSAVTARQVATFRALCSAVDQIVDSVRWRHIANSALLMLGDPEGNLVRPGIMLYGAAPALQLPRAGHLRPVMSLSTAIVFLKRVPAGTPLSYGGTFTTQRESRIATLPVGYADGYRRAFSNRARVLVRGLPAPVVGRVCMDLCLVDVTDIPGAAVGDQVVLLGQQGGGRITADDLAAHLGTISYELFCGIGPRVPRVYCGGPLGYDDDAGPSAREAGLQER